jgi:RNA recognition motif-containing protein
MGKKLYVGNLSYNTREAQLRALFEQAGPVDAVTIITDRETGRSKGFGFVEMRSEAEAQAAIKQFNGLELDGQALKVNEARPKGERSDRGGAQRGRGGRRY